MLHVACYMWHEGVAKGGASNVASLVYDFIVQASLCKLFNNKCGGQNKNKAIMAMHIHASRTLNVKISHYFLEKGHTQNEGDSDHATIERKSKSVNVYIHINGTQLFTRLKRRNVV